MYCPLVYSPFAGRNGMGRGALSPTLPDTVFTPLSISGLQLWLDATDLSTLFQDSSFTTPVTANNDPVGGWQDKSGQGKHCTQTGASTVKPTYKTGVQNGLPAIYFDGGDELIHTLQYLTGQANSTLAVVKRNGGAGGYQVILYAKQPCILAQTTTSANWGTYQSININSSYSLDGTTRVIANVVRSYNDLDLITDNNAIENKTTGTGWYVGGNSSLGGNGIGAQFFTGWIMELFSYNKALSLSEHQAARNYLNGRWGVY